jgi:serine/threonine protein phosphatase PrpC
MDVSETIQTRCPGCDAPIAEGDVFCERCGARLAGAVEEDSLGDRVEIDQGIAAGVSDRGRVHARNEDAMSLAVQTEQRVAVVVCDGISSASAGDLAAQNAAEAAGGRLERALLDVSQDAAAVVGEAIEAAHAAVAGVPWTTRVDRDAPSCTLVCALCRDGELVIGSVGDSRAYWLGEDLNCQLTTDDSWAEEQVVTGAMTEEEAMNDPRAHTITSWIGGDAPGTPPQIATFRPQEAGRLVLCSDGLWNYAPTPGELRELIERLPRGASPAAVARALTDAALGRGGRDNITVAIIDVEPEAGNYEPVLG